MEHGVNHMMVTTTSSNTTENGTLTQPYSNFSIPAVPYMKDVSENNNYYTIVLVGLGLAIYTMLYLRRRRNKKKYIQKREEEYLSYYHSILPQSRIYGGARPSDTSITNMAKVIEKQRSGGSSVSHGLASVAGLLLLDQYPDDDNTDVHQADTSPDQTNNKIAELVKKLKNGTTKACETEDTQVHYNDSSHENNTKIAELVQQLTTEKTITDAEEQSEYDSVFTDEQLTQIVELILLEQLTEEGTDVFELYSNSEQGSSETQDIAAFQGKPRNCSLKQAAVTGFSLKSGNTSSVNSEQSNISQIHDKPDSDSIQNFEITLEIDKDTLHDNGVVTEDKIEAAIATNNCGEFKADVFTICNNIHDNTPDASTLSTDDQQTQHNQSASPSTIYMCTHNDDDEKQSNNKDIQKWDRYFRDHLNKHKHTVVKFHDDQLTATWI